MTVKTAAGSKFEIGPAATSATNTSTAYAALTPYTVVGEIENFGALGDSATAVTFLSVGDARVRKAKGSNDAGDMVITVGKDPLDAGQLALKAAQKSKNDFAFRVTLADKPEDGGTNTIFYFRGLVMSARDTVGGADDIVRTEFTIGINSEIIEVAATEAP